MKPPTPLARELRRHLRSWCRHRLAQALARATVVNDEAAVERLVAWLALKRPKLRTLVELTRQVFADYGLYLAVYETVDGSRLKAATRKRHLMSVRSFFGWLTREGKLLRDPARDIELPKVPERLPRGVLTLKEVEEVLGVPDLKTPLGLRDRAILECLYSTALRNAELRALKLNDLNLTEGFLTVRMGKGGRDRVVPLGRVAERFLTRYIEEARPGLKRSRFEEAVFLNATGTPLITEILVRIVRRIGEKAGLRKRLTPHVFRHTCATHMLRGRADVRHIQEMLGHKCLSSTEVYTRVAQTDLKRVHRRCHPRERRPK